MEKTHVISTASGYCDLNGKFPLKLMDGSDARGVLGETAVPFCGDGFEASGSSDCPLAWYN